MRHDLSGARTRLAVAAVAVAGWLLPACEDEQPTESSGSPSCTINCGDAAVPPPGLGAGPGTAGGIGTPGGVGVGGTTARPGAVPGTVGGIAPGGNPSGASTPGGNAAGAGTMGGGTAGGGTAAGGGDLPCDVKAIVAQRCGSCHGPTPVSAPMPLATLANWQAAGFTDKTKKTYQIAKARINATGAAAMPPPSIGTLSADEKTKLNAWLDKNAPAGTESCGNMPTGPKEIDTSGLDCYKLLAHAPGSKTAKYKVGAVADAYINFGFQAPWRGTLYLQVFKPVIDNPAALHHWLLYREPVADGSVTATIGQHAGGELLNGWAPGGDPSDLRTHGDLSMELPASTYSIEIHYNSSDPNAQDASGVEVCGKSTPTKDIGSLSWLGYANGGAISYATGFCIPATSWTGTCDPGHTQPIHLVSLTPHLHQTGRHIKSIINGPNGSRVLHDKVFDFAYQVTYDTHEVLMPGETITTTCDFSEPQCAGQSTNQEMCYLYVMHYPKKTLVDYGPEGTLMHGEGVCLGQ